MIYDVDVHAMTSFHERIAMLNLNIDITTSSIEEIVGQSDIVCTETSIEVGKGPLFEKLETKAHLHINAVGQIFRVKSNFPSIFSKKVLCVQISLNKLR